MRYQNNRILVEAFGHRVTKSSLWKWDKEILNQNREWYSPEDIQVLNAILVLHNFGYDSGEIKHMIVEIMSKRNCDQIFKNINARISLQKHSLEFLFDFLTTRVL